MVENRDVRVICVQGRAKKFLPSSQAHVHSGLMGCVVHSLPRSWAGVSEHSNMQKFFAPPRNL